MLSLLWTRCHFLPICHILPTFDWTPEIKHLQHSDRNHTATLGRLRCQHLPQNFWSLRCLNSKQEAEPTTPTPSQHSSSSQTMSVYLNYSVILPASSLIKKELQIAPELQNQGISTIIKTNFWAIKTQHCAVCSHPAFCKLTLLDMTTSYLLKNLLTLRSARIFA